MKSIAPKQRQPQINFEADLRKLSVSRPGELLQISEIVIAIRSIERNRPAPKNKNPDE
jgi:hypothetical protein